MAESLFKCFGYDHNSEESEEKEEITIINQSVENTNVASSSSSPPRKYEVFLSFRGEDTRCGFTSHLEKRLRDKKIDTFIDNRLNKGDKISDALIEAIRGSKMSVIIFSANYARSSWCMEEVLYIVECMEKQRQVVVPVFYEVDPSRVRKQKGSYEAAFKDLKKRFEEEKVKQWKSALTRVANLSGFPYPAQPYETESDVIDAIVEDILKKLKDMSSREHHIKDLVGIEESIKGVKKLLQHDSRDVRIIGIWGMGGLGKTTLARAVFEQLSSNFEGRCFLENVREKSRKLEGPEKLKKQLFSELLEENDIKDITDFHKERLRRKKVLIVLDDVDQPELLDDLTGDQRWFGGGSRVIVTTRDDQVLRHRANDKYELGGLSSECSLELFNLNALKGKSPTSEDIELSKRVVNYAKGIPLALKVIGRFLSSRRRENWEIELDRLKEVPNKIVQNALKISYDVLDEQEQRVFLDIVCFVDVGEKTCRHYVEHIVGGGRSLKLEIDNLIDKSLIFEEQGNLRMHDLVREMGWEIVRHPSREPGERSRLWNVEDCNNVLKNNKGTKEIQGISQSTTQYSKGNPIELSSTVFKEMCNLWFLRINLHSDCSYTCSEERLDYLSSTLKFLEWNYWPFKSMPKSFSLSNLVELRIRDCKLETLIWSEELNNLKHVDLSGSDMLTDVSALSKAPNLESVVLFYCNSLRIVPPLRFSDKNYHTCDNWRCSRLGYLNLGCNKSLEVFSIISGNVKTLNIGACHNLKQLLSCVLQLKSLTTLNLVNCKISEIPSEIGCLNLLEELDLSCNPIGELPEGIKHLSKLKKLMIFKCTSLECLPELPLSLELVNACGCTGLHTISDSRDKLKQEQLSEYHVTRHWRFLYANCLLLSEDTCHIIFEEFQLRVLRLAAKIHSNSFNVEELGHPDVYICIPRYINIREWLTEYSEGPTITVKLPLQWHNATFLGFAICVQVEVLTKYFMIRYLMCNFELRKKNGENRIFEWSYIDKHNDYFNYYTTEGNSNMLMWYKYENYISCSDAEEVSLNFSDRKEYAEEVAQDIANYGVTACGIRLLYGQEYEEKFEKSNVVRLD